ncbi:hypothetical protein KI387_004736, partial [Taxus chinensis]
PDMFKGCAMLLRGESSNPVLSAGEERDSTTLPTHLRDVVRRNTSLAKDVFLSHSGKQKLIVGQVHQDLIKKSISCFFDEDPQSLPLAEKFPPHIFEAAEKCRLAVLFLSKEFIHSKWPMLELSAFIKAKNSNKNPDMKILPVFFMIPSEYLAKIMEEKDNQGWKDMGISDEVQAEWRKALREIRSFNGLEFKEAEDVVGFRDEVVKAICSLLLPQSHSSMQAQAHQSQ